MVYVQVSDVSERPIKMVPAPPWGERDRGRRAPLSWENKMKMGKE